MHLADIYVDPQVTGRMLGWVGAIFFAFCAVPQVIRTLKDGHAENLSSLFLWMWFSGALLCAGGTLLDVGVVPWLQAVSKAAAPVAKTLTDSTL